MNDSVRLAKRLAEQIGCSRAEAERYIAGGWVSVDGKITEEAGARIAPAQIVALLPSATLESDEPVTILLHKPVALAATAALTPDQDCITPATRAPDDHCQINFLKRHARDLTLTNPLEDRASGLIVLTQDWRIVRKLSTDGNRIEQEFVVEVSGTLGADGLQHLQQSSRWNGKAMTALKVSWQSEQRLRFAIKGAERGMVEHLCAQVGLQATAIKRIRIGRVSMGALPSATWRYLMGYEKF